MSISYKNYPIVIDGSSTLEDIAQTITGVPGAIIDGVLGNNPAQNYEKAVKGVLDKITKRKNGVGDQVLAAFPKNKTIFIVPYIPDKKKEQECNPETRTTNVFEKGKVRIRFNPADWKAGAVCAKSAKPVGTAVGTDPDEALLHELLHAYRFVRGTRSKIVFNKEDKMYGDIEELFAILTTNIYMSENGKIRLRKDHNDYFELPAKWATSETFMRDPDYFPWIENFWWTERPLIPNIAMGTAAFNPFRAYKVLINA